MTIIIGIVSQKGGVGKSTLARLIAREIAAQDWTVKIADLDVSQATSYKWRSRRLSHQLEPDVPVEQFARVDRALGNADHYHLMILDGAPHATAATEEIAKASHLVIIPTGLALDDLEPGVQLAHDMVKKKVPRTKIVFALCRAGDSMREIAEARDYISNARYEVLNGELHEKAGYRLASDEGKAVTETRFSSLNVKAEVLAQSIVDKIAELA